MSSRILPCMNFIDWRYIAHSSTIDTYYICYIFTHADITIRTSKSTGLCWCNLLYTEETQLPVFWRRTAAMHLLRCHPHPPPQHHHQPIYHIIWIIWIDFTSITLREYLINFPLNKNSINLERGLPFCLGWRQKGINIKLQTLIFLSLSKGS